MSAVLEPAGITDAELERYARQLVIPDFGFDAQVRLRQADVLVVGCGALGTAAAGYLVAAGVGRVGIVDPDAVDLTNLQRQLTFLPDDIGESKAVVAAGRFAGLNPGVLVEAYPARFDSENGGGLVSGRSLVLDCSDNFETRYAVNDACVSAGVPLIESGVLGLDGIVMTIVPGRSACYRCAFPDPPEPGSRRTCAEAGMLGPVAGVVGALQALEAVKLLADVGISAVDRVVQIEGRTLAFTSLTVRRRPGCVSCRDGASDAPANAGKVKE